MNQNRYRYNFKRSMRLIYCLLALHISLIACKNDSTNIVENQTEAQPVIENMADFIGLFPQLNYPYHLATHDSSFQLSSYKMLEDSLCQRFLSFEPWITPNSDDHTTIYAVGALPQSDTSSLLLYMNMDSSNYWKYNQITLAHVSDSGRFLGRFIFGLKAENLGDPNLSNRSVLQAGTITSNTNGVIHIKSMNSDTLQEESHKFSVHQDGEIDSEYVIKE